MTQERPGSTARGPQHVMIKLQIYNTSPHFGKGIVSIMMLVRQGSSLRAACAQMGLSYSKAWRLLKSAEADLGIPLSNGILRTHQLHKNTLPFARTLACYVLYRV